jgi:hypothetical protein
MNRKYECRDLRGRRVEIVLTTTAVGGGASAAPDEWMTTYPCRGLCMN